MQSEFFKNLVMKTSRTLNVGKNWGKRDVETSITTRADISFAHEHYLKFEQSCRDSLHVYQNLFMLDGLLDVIQYNKVVADIETSLKTVRDELNIKAYILVIVENGKVVGSKMCDNDVILNMACHELFNCDYAATQNPLKVPERFRGTIAFEQEWGVSVRQVFSKMKAGS